MSRVTYFATDAADNQEPARTLDVKLDFGAPAISGMPDDACTLWPVNHEVVQVAVVTATDAVSGVAPASFEVTATSNEPTNPHEPDFVVTPDGSGGFVVELRAERFGTGAGRLYTITATATDLAGNVTTTTATCSVPHDLRKE